MQRHVFLNSLYNYCCFSDFCVIRVILIFLLLVLLLLLFLLMQYKYNNSGNPKQGAKQSGNAIIRGSMLQQSGLRFDIAFLCGIWIFVADILASFFSPKIVNLCHCEYKWVPLSLMHSYLRSYTDIGWITSRLLVVHIVCPCISITYTLNFPNL